MLTPWNAMFTTMVKDEKMLREVLGLAEPRKEGPILLYRAFRGGETETRRESRRRFRWPWSGGNDRSAGTFRSVPAR